MGGRAIAMLCLVGCGPRVILPSDDEGGDATAPPGGSTSSAPTMTTALPPATTAPPTTTSPDSTGDATTSGPWTPDWGLPPGTTGACLPWTFEGCGDLFEQNAFTTGGSPLGDFETYFAVFAADALCESCVDTPNVNRVILVDDPAAVPEWEPDDGLVLDLYAFEGPDFSQIEGLITGFRDGMIATAPVTIYIEDVPSAEQLAEPFDPDAPVVVRGTFDALSDGWSMYGNFAAVYCPRLNNYAICE